jgi:hypothetical protein
VDQKLKIKDVPLEKYSRYWHCHVHHQKNDEIKGNKKPLHQQLDNKNLDQQQSESSQK